jgi:broad specificity phosphatase PhoE
MEQSTQVVLVRHAETQTITSQKIHGQTDGPLSERGIRDAQKTAQHFRGQSFDAFYCSPLGRAMTTAGIIADAINMAPVPVDGLKERYYGWLEGRSMKWFEPDLSGPKLTLPLVKFALWASGERGDDFVRRVTTTFDTIAEKHRGERVLIVLHWGLLSVLTQYLQEKDLSVWRGVGPWIACGISEYHHNNNGTWKPIHFDNGRHLL